MALVQYTGALAPKKKQELAEIAEKMSLEISGTKDELHARIKAYLEANDLTENAMFAGLYPTKKRPSRKETASSSIIPRSATSDEEAPVRRKASYRRKVTPPPIISADSEGAVTTLTAPPSPIRALINNSHAAISNALPDSQALVHVAEKTGTNLRVKAIEVYSKSRVFMSNATNIASLSIALEFLFILFTITPWEFYELPVSKPGMSSPMTIAYPPLSFLLSAHLYKQLSFWFIPTVLAPQVAGSLISFTTPPKDIDPLSAGIVKLALAAILDDSWYVVGGRAVSQWRIVGAATNLAFAMAEAVEERRVVTRESPTHT